MFSKKTVLLVLVVSLLAALVVACGAAPTPQTITVVETVVVEKEVQGETVTVVETVEKEVIKEVEVEKADPMADKVTLNYNLGTEPPTGDPALNSDTTSNAVVTNLFNGLTQVDPKTSEVTPNLATEWSVSADGLEWTFKMRDDVPWVKYNPLTGETTQEVDADGNPRFVNANDVVYGVRRSVDPATASDFAYIIYGVKNALELNTGMDKDDNPTTLTMENLGVEAVDDTTVKFTLEQPAGYFPAQVAVSVFWPQPQWAIEEWSEKWTEAGLIVTNGPYVLSEWIHGGSLQMLKNPLWVKADDVQIEVLNFVMIQEDSTAFALYENNELDSVPVPLPEMDRVKADPTLSKEYYQAPQACTYYYGFVWKKAPFDDVRVRRAFAAAIDRQSLIDNVLKGGQIPASTFAPPGIFGAPEPGTLGQGTDVELAKASLQEFLDEKKMTVEEFSKKYDIVLGINTNEGHARIAAAVQQMWKENLGVDVRVENQEWKVYLDTTRNDTPIEDAFHIFRMGWCADYADENNWLNEVMNSELGENRMRRNCADDNCSKFNGPDAFDELTIKAAASADPEERKQIYAEAEDMLSGEMAAYAPIYHYTNVFVNKPWLTRNFPNIGGLDFFNWKIDWEAKKAATGQ